MNQQLANPNENKDNRLTALVDNPDYRSRIRELMGERAPQFISSMLTIGKALGDVEPKSLITACVTAATLDLPINQNLGFAWIVPYRDGQGGPKIAQFQLGYRGFVQLAMRTGQYRFINAGIIYEGELVRYDKLTGELKLKEDYEKPENGKPIGYFSYFRTLNGFEHALYMTVEQVRAHAQKYSQSFRKNYGPWKDEFDSMALKTVLKLNLSRWGVLSVQMEKALFEDQAVRRDIHAEAFYPDGNDSNGIGSPTGLPALTQGEGGEPGGEKNVTPRPEKPARGKKKVKCDGNHGAPKCDDPECWLTETIADQVEAKLKEAGYTEAELVKMAIANNFVQDTTITTVAQIPETVLATFLKNWESTVEELAEQKTAGKPVEKSPLD